MLIIFNFKYINLSIPFLRIVSLSPTSLDILDESLNKLEEYVKENYGK